MDTATCSAINTAIVRETGRIGPEISTRVVPNTPWVALTPRAPWEDPMGLIQTNMMFERMLPANDAEAWANVAISDGNTNNCLPPTEILTWGQTLRTWQMQKIAKETEEFCVEDLRSAFQMAKVMQEYTDGLATVSRWVWENRDRNEYIRLCLHQVTEGPESGFNLNATSFDPANPPTSRLTWGTLERIYSQLMREGVAGVGFNGVGAPVLPLLTDEVTTRDLIRQDPELRSDFRFAYEGKGETSPLLAPFFSSGMSYNGFKPMVDFFPQRFEIVGGQYVRIPPFTTPLATTKGTKRDLNVNYINASYQVSVIHVRDVLMQHVPSPVTTVGSKMRFSPVDYMGDFKWIMESPGSHCNPDGTIGRFRGVFASATEPLHPELGYAIMHKNCPPIRELKLSCYS